MQCRVLPHETLSGPANMALDEALLDSVDADPTSAVLRTYEWDEPTLSLGYFQKAAEIDADPRWRGVPVVRRPSGGGALWHDREITYAIVLPRSHPLAGRPSNLYRAAHAAIAGLLRDRGIPAERRGPTEGGGGRDRPFLCFLDRDPEDILIGGAKVVGSAQRRRPSAVLQHGSLLLAGSPRTPELPGLLELTGRAPDATVWSEMIRGGLPASIGLTPLPDCFPEETRSQARFLEETVYRDRGWTARR